jgi:hypothetical protein
MLGWYRRLKIWARQYDEFQGITPLNSPEEWEAASPDTLTFHWLIKKPLRYVAHSIKVPQHWIDRLEGNPKALYDIVDRVYFRNEKQAWRKAILEPVIRFGLCLYSFDNNYTEVFDSLLSAIIRERGRFEFAPSTINPDNWYQDGRGRVEVQSSNPFSVLSISDREFVTDREIETPIVSTYDPDSGAVQYLALSLIEGFELFPGIFVYPILARGPGVLDVAPAIPREGASS